MNTHTPGPWEVLPEQPHRQYIRIRSAALGGRYRISNVLGLKYENTPLHGVSETRANACLIAAAPKLMAALVALDNYLSNNLSSDYPTGIDLSSLEFRNASKAIAKATGAAA